MLTRDRAICLRVVNYSETSQIVTLLCRQSGKIGAIAKGSRRPKSAFGGPLEVFSYGEALFTSPAEGKLATLAEFEPQPLFRALRMNLEGLNCALLAAELIDAFTHEGGAHPELFDAMLQFLRDVQETSARSESLGLLILFELTMLREIGILPVLSTCANCRRPWAQSWRQVYFSASANGLLCENCEQSFSEKTRLSPAVAQILSDPKMLAKAPEALLNDVEKVLIYHFRELMHRQPKMARHVLK